MRIAVLGTGGVGGYFGGRLVEAGADVVFIARGAHLEAIQNYGLAIDSVAGDCLVRSVQATNDPKKIGPVDVVLLGVKAWQISEAAQAMRPMVKPSTCVVPLQNGVEAPSQLAAALGPEHVLGGLCSLIVHIAEPGRIRHSGGVPSIKFGEMDNRQSGRVDVLYRAFSDAKGLAVEVPPDIQLALWNKFLFIAPWGGVGAVTRAPIGIIREQRGTCRLLRRIMQEILEVAEAHAVDMGTDALSDTMAALDSLPPQATASMQRDIMKARPSELEAQVGAVLRLGRQQGVETPLSEVIYHSLLAMEKRARGQLQFE